MVVEDYADTVIDNSELGAGLGAGAAVGDRPRRRPFDVRRRGRPRARLNQFLLTPSHRRESRDAGVGRVGYQ